MIAGVLAAQLFSSLPPAWLICSGAAIGSSALLSSRLRQPAWVLLALCWALWNYQLRLTDRVETGLANQVVTVSGFVSSIPSVATDFIRFRFSPDAEHRAAGLPAMLLVSWYRDLPAISAGEYWQLELKVKPPWGAVNFQGPDREKWLFAQGIGGLGTVRKGQLLAPPADGRYQVNTIREKVLQSITSRVRNERQRGVIQALATAERSGLEAKDRALMNATGTSHLLAISGLHVGLAAVGGMWLSRALFLLLPVSGLARAGLPLTVAGGLVCAACYSALAGFGIPTLRSVLMLAAAMFAVLLARSIHPARALVISLAIILLINPFAPLGAGMWFSFLAVASLLWVFQTRTGVFQWWKTLLMAQTAVILALLPIGLLWFNSFSPSSFVANLFAIPFVSILVVPLVLAGLAMLPVSGTLAGLLWSVAGMALSVLFGFLEMIVELQGMLPMLSPPSWLQAAVALFGAILIMLPRGIPVRWMGLLLIAPLWLPAGQRTAAGVIAMEVLDAGQGTAVLVSSGQRSLLYDSGPGNGREFDLVRSVIAPALARQGDGAPDRIIISHGDMDHAGGLRSLLQRYPEARYTANLNHGELDLGACHQKQRWKWPGSSFSILHPSGYLPYLGNDSSCVVSLAGTGGKLLLAGDISDVVENRLLAEGLSSHKLLLVPHHGSKTSSSQAFLERLNPEVAVATASLGNRFGFPLPEIRERYERMGTKFWSTGACGALRIVLGEDGSVHASSARREQIRIWRWPADENCP